MIAFPSSPIRTLLLYGFGANFGKVYLKAKEEGLTLT